MHSLWKSTDAGASGSPLRSVKAKALPGPRSIALERDEPSHALLCALTTSVLNRQPALGRPGADQGDAEEAVKVAAARAGLRVRTSEPVRKAVEAVLYVRHGGARRRWA